VDSVIMNEASCLGPRREETSEAHRLQGHGDLRVTRPDAS
jgi:hypothetical protein